MLSDGTHRRAMSCYQSEEMKMIHSLETSRHIQMCHRRHHRHRRIQMCATAPRRPQWQMILTCYSRSGGLILDKS